MVSFRFHDTSKGLISTPEFSYCFIKPLFWGLKVGKETKRRACLSVISEKRMRNCLFTNSSLNAIKTTMIFLSFREIKRNFIFIQELRLELNRILPIWCVLRFTQAYVLETKNDQTSLPHG